MGTIKDSLHMYGNLLWLRDRLNINVKGRAKYNEQFMSIQLGILSGAGENKSLTVSRLWRTSDTLITGLIIEFKWGSGYG